MLNRAIINMDKTGKRIHELREKAGLSVKVLAEELGYARTQPVYDWQKGKVMPSAENLVALAYIFNVTVDDILVTELK